VPSPSALLTANLIGVGDITSARQPQEQRCELLFARRGTKVDLSIVVVQVAQNLTLTPANSSVTFSSNYLVAMVDSGAIGTNQSGRQVRH
jgi:hypothetical protein